MRGLLTRTYLWGRRVFSDTPLEQVASKLYWRVSNKLHRVNSPIQFYRINRVPATFEPVVIAISKPQNEIVHGEYERPVLEQFSQMVDEDSTVWEIGARWGYYSLMASTVAEHVVAAEADPSRVSLLHASRYANKFDNLDIIEGIAGKDYQLDEFTPPDIVLIDVEGAEFSVLEGAEKWLAAGETTFIVEVHEIPGSVLESSVTDLFESHSYDIEKVYQRADDNIHIVATPSR